MASHSDRNHYWVNKARGPARLQQCARHAETGETKSAYDWATIHGESGEDPWADFVPLCRGCHIHYDGNSRGPRELSAEGRAGVLAGIAARLAATGCNGCGIDRTGDQYTPGCSSCGWRRRDRRRVPRGR